MAPPVASHQWSTPIGLVCLGWLLAVSSGVWAVLAVSPVDRVFAVVLAFALAAVSGLGSLLRPRLRADSGGVSIRHLTGTDQWGWPDVHFAVRQHRRLGIQARALELDLPASERAPGGLVIFTRIDLGDDPEEVAEVLSAIAPANE